MKKLPTPSPLRNLNLNNVVGGHWGVGNGLTLDYTGVGNGKTLAAYIGVGNGLVAEEISPAEQVGYWGVGNG